MSEVSWKRVSLLFLSMVLVPSICQAKGILIACEISGTGYFNSIPLGPPETATRYYILDDSKKSVRGVFAGKQQDVCEPGKCSLEYTDSSITLIELTDGRYSKTIIDRLAGRLTESTTQAMARGTIQLNFQGPCSMAPAKRF